MARYVALLRGINVGGNNLIKMPALKACVEALGMQNVSTYIASGNVLFDAAGAATRVAAQLEAGLSKEFGYTARVTLRTAAQLRAVVERAPKGFGKAPAKFRYDVIFLLDGLTASAAAGQLDPRAGVDQVWAGDGVVYFSRLIARAAQSRLSKVVSLPVYKQMTIRNWNTTSKLLQLASGRRVTKAAPLR